MTCLKVYDSTELIEDVNSGLDVCKNFQLHRPISEFSQHERFGEVIC